jgi:hypothetical protein
MPRFQEAAVLVMPNIFGLRQECVCVWGGGGVPQTVVAWAFTSAGIRIRIGNADPDPGARK